MPALIIVSTMLIFCLIMTRLLDSCLHCSITLLVVTCVCNFHLSIGTSCMPRYTYGSFWCNTGSVWFLYLICWARIWFLNLFGYILDLFGQPVMAHLVTPKSMPAHSQNLSILFSCVCIDCGLLVSAARSSVYAAELTVICDVPKMYPFFPLCSHLRSGSNNIRKRYGLRVSPCMVPLCIGIGLVLPKCSPIGMVFEWEYIFPISIIASSGYPRSFITVSSRA